jgi:trypsin
LSAVRRLSVLFVLAVVAVLTLGVAPASQAIVGGAQAPEGAYRFTASLQDGSGFHFCGGSVVAPGWVLTAAHCVVDDDGSDLWVVTGKNDLDAPGGQRIKVERIVVHPDYANNTHDAALLQLSSSTSSPAIELAGGADDDLEADGRPVKVTGWGDTLPTFGLFATQQLHEVDLNVVADGECGQTNVGFDPATGVCAAALLKDSCQGDSGGPLFATKDGERVQIGVVSYGFSCGIPRFPGVYSEVNNAAIRSWITTTAGV